MFPVKRSLTRFAHLGCMLASFGCLSLVGASLLGEQPKKLDTVSERNWTDLETGQMIFLDVPEEHRTGAKEIRLDVLIHFHGDREVVLDNCRMARLRGVLVVVNYKGLSEAYRVPFSDQQRFARLLIEVRNSLRQSGHLSSSGELGRVDISSFSAGYGAVREIIKQREYFERITGVLMADSIYAGYSGEASRREVNRQNMAGFLELAKSAIAGQKVFIITHTQLKTTGYASTSETADYLITSLNLNFAPLGEFVDNFPSQGRPELKLLTKTESGGFRVLSYAGDDGPSHLEHLRQIGRWLPLLRTGRPR